MFKEMMQVTMCLTKT